MADYLYSLSTDFVVTNTVDSGKLITEIEDSTIITATSNELDSVDVDYGDDECKLKFSDSLDAGEQTVLDGIVAAHDGTPYAESSSGFSSSATESNTNSSAFLVKLTHTESNLAPGDYVVSWYFEATSSVSDVDAEYRLQLDGTTDLMTVIPPQVKKIDGGAWYDHSGTKMISLAAGDHTLELGYRSISGANDTYIRNASILFQPAS